MQCTNGKCVNEKKSKHATGKQAKCAYVHMYNKEGVYDKERHI